MTLSTDQRNPTVDHSFYGMTGLQKTGGGVMKRFDKIQNGRF